MRNAIIAGSILVVAAIASWRMIVSPIDKTKDEKPPPAANVPKVIKEEDLNTVILTADAEKRIGLTIGTIELNTKPLLQTYGGEAMIPVGKSIIVSAPFTGVLSAPNSGMPKVGQNVRAGDVIFRLQPLLSPDSKATLAASLTDAEGQVNNAKTQLDLAKIAMDRANKVMMDGAGSQRMVDEAKAAFDLANKTLEAASARYDILKKVLADAETRTTAAYAITSPGGGVLRNLTATADQKVPAGAILFEVFDPSNLWVRVSVPVGDRNRIDPNASATVNAIGQPLDANAQPAKPISAPPSANPLASTVDLYYELNNTKYHPGERLQIGIAAKTPAKMNIVPWSAIAIDVYGGTWVYEVAAEHRYVRRRVVVNHSRGDIAVLESGPAPGTKIVTAGVMQLFASETGFVK